MKDALAKVLDLYRSGADEETMLAALSEGLAGGFKPGDFVYYEGAGLRWKGQVKAIVEGWPEVVFADGSTAYCRPSSLVRR